MNEVSVVNRSKATVVGSRIAVADSFLTRLVGLIGKRSLDSDQGLLISPSSGVHTCWMSMSIDVVALDRANRVIKLAHNVRPWRLSGLSTKTSRILELPPGRIQTAGIEVGDQLAVE
jgi:uncharacterized membrane protein (UPF0127 family)